MVHRTSTQLVLPHRSHSLSIYIAEYDSGTGEFYNSAGGFAFGLSASNAASNGDGTYTLDTERAR